MLGLLAALAVTSGGCKQKQQESLIVVALTAADPDAASIRSVTVSAGDVLREFSAPNGLSASPWSVGVYVPSSAIGPIAVTASATGATRCFSGTASTTLAAPGATASIAIALDARPCMNSDAGPGGAGGSGAGGVGGTGVGGTGGGAAGGAGGGGASDAGTEAGAGGGAAGGGGTSDAGTGGSGQILPPPSLNTCTEVNQFPNNDACATNWGISVVAFSPDGRYLAAGDQSGAVKLWNMNGGTATAEGHTLTLSTNGNMQPAFSPNGLLLAGATTNGGLAVWNAGGAWQKRGDIPTNVNSDFRGLAFTPDSSQIVVVDFGLGTLQIYSASTLMGVGAARSLPAKPESLAVARVTTGAALTAAVGLADGRVAVLDLNAPAQSPALVTVAASTVSIDSVALSPNAQVLAAGTSLDTTKVTLWSLGAQIASKTPAPNLGANAEGGVEGLAFSPDGQNLLVGFGYFSPTVGIWDTSIAQNHGTKSPLYAPLGVAFSPQGNVIVAGEAFCGWILICAD